MSRLRVAVWGLGRHAVRKILPAIAATPELVLAGVCSRNPETVASQSRAWNCQGWTDAEAMLRDGGVDVVFVSTPIGLHGEHGRRVLAAGRHLWCEKPLATSAKVTQELLETAGRKGLAVCEAMMYLHHPHFAQLHETVIGRLGTVLSVGSRFGIPPLDYASFRTDPALGGGALFDVGCYPISAVHALFPDRETRVVLSRVGSRDGATVDTDGAVLLEIAGGPTAYLEWRINCAYRNELTIWGTQGSVTARQVFSKQPTFVPALDFHDLRGVSTVEPGAAADHFVAMMQRFIEITTGGADAAGERARILRTAAVMDEIWRRRNG